MALLRNRALFALAIVSLLSGGIGQALAGEPATAGITDAKVETGNYFEAQIIPLADSNFRLALFRAWIPKRERVCKAVLVVAPVSDADGIPLAEDPKWQAVAERWGCALVAVTLTTCDSSVPYYRAECGSGQALLSALEEFARKSGHDELQRIPIAILGHSQGGEFATHFACWKPGRTAVFATIKGGYYDVQPDAAGRSVPGLLIAGEKDSPFRPRNIRALFDRNSVPWARWAFALEPNSGHELARSLGLILPFFDAVLSGNLEPFRGDLKTFAIQPESASGDAGCAWLPNRAVGEIWNHFMTAGSVEFDPELKIPAKMPAPVAYASSAAWDFANVEDGQPSEPAVFTFRQETGGPAWNSLQAVSLRGRSTVAVAQSENRWTVSVRPKLDGLPLGRLRDFVFVTFLKDNQPVLGGTVLNLSFNHGNSALSVFPASLYFGIHSEACQKTLTLKSTNEKPLHIRAVQLQTGEGATATVAQGAAFSATITAEISPLSKSGQHSGTFAVQIDEPVSDTLIIPFMGYYRASGETGDDETGGAASK